MELIINSEQSLEDAISQLREQFKEKKYVKAKLSYGRQRTLSQNAALHMFCDNLAISLNDAGLDQRSTLREGIEMPWTMESVKVHLWKPIQLAVTGLDSTTKPEASQYQHVYEVLNRNLASRLGLSVEWPNKDGMNA